MNTETMDSIAIAIIVVSVSYIGIIIFLIVASYWNDVTNGILKFFSHGADIEDIRKSIALFKKDELENSKYNKTVRMSYRKFYKLWQSEKFTMSFNECSVDTSYTINDEDSYRSGQSIVWVTIYFTLFDTIFRYIPLKRSIDYYKRDTNKSEKCKRIKRLRNRNETIKEIDEFVKREE